jgi:hypothetical protein
VEFVQGVIRAADMIGNVGIEVIIIIIIIISISIITIIIIKGVLLSHLN